MSSLNYLIRDATTDDIQACLSLDHDVTTERVWQMNIFNEPRTYQYTFREERLPREIDVRHPKSASRLHLALENEACYLVAESKTNPENDDDDTPVVIGYLSMAVEPVHAIARIQDIVVDAPFRRSGIGTRLLTIARRWAAEHHMRRLLVETQTQNYPAITFCQSNGLEFCGFNEQYFENRDIAIFFGQSIG